MLFSFQNLKLSTKDIIIVLKDALNTTLGPLPIPDPHATGVPSNTLERHLIGSRVVNSVCNLVNGLSMTKLVGFLTFDSTFTYKKGKNTSVVDNHSFQKFFHSFPKVVPNERTSMATEFAIVDNTESTI
jgi:hypothetical protein